MNNQNYQIQFWLKLSARTATILLIGGVFIWGCNTTTKKANPVSSPTPPPAGPQTLLTLSDGRQLALDTTIHDSAFTDGNSVVVIHEGSLLYIPGNQQTDSPSYNTLTTPRDGKWRLVLPDSTIIWLEPSSFIRYATNKIPKITFRGAAHFQRNTITSFIVTINDTAHSIAARQFNISARPDNPPITITETP